jgi:hypothetical protein
MNDSDNGVTTNQDPPTLTTPSGTAATTSPTDAPDEISQPPHYKGPVPGIECIEVSQHFPANIACAIQYLWRADIKGTPTKDMRKAIKFITFEINLREGRRPHDPIDEPSPQIPTCEVPDLVQYSLSDPDAVRIALVLYKERYVCITDDRASGLFITHSQKLMKAPHSFWRSIGLPNYSLARIRPR